MATICSFLDDLDRIATPVYEPLDEHILRARLRTLGVQEFIPTFDGPMVSDNHFPLDIYNNLQDLCADGWAVRRLEYGREWVIQYIGGARTSVRLSVHIRGDLILIILVSAISLASLCRQC
jgi:guanine nucleotide-binding protein alpha-1 subunit